MKEKKLILLTLFVLLFPFFPGEAQKVTIDVSMPGKGVAGERIPVKVVIHKGDYSDFARFRQVLPNGFDVSPVETSNSDFTLKNGELKFIWLKLPQEKTVTLAYDLIPDIHLRGGFQITGLFSYISGQERQEVEVPAQSIEIAPAQEGTAAQNIVAPSVAATESPVTGLKAPPGPVVFRGQPVKDPSGRGWIIRLIVNRGPLEKLGRLEEIIPQGYLPENIDGNGAIFSYREGLVKYIWMSFPQDSVFEVSYKLVPQEGTSPDTPPALSGYFSYMKDDASKRMRVRSLPAEVPAGADEATLYALAAAGSTVEEPPAAQPETTAVAEEPPAQQPVAGGGEKETGTPPSQAAARENVPGQPTEIVQHAPQQSEGIYFRVQLLASAHPVETEDYFRRYNVPGKIYREYDNGLYKYTTGSFTSYREARAFVARLRETTGIEEAFVTAYDNGRRITVREALSRTGQKWFK